MPLPSLPRQSGVQQKAGPLHDEGDPDGAPPVTARHRHHRFLAPQHAMKVLYGSDEHAKILHAAEIAGLRPSSYVAAAALAMAEQVHGDAPAGEDSTRGGHRRSAALAPHHDRESLVELIRARLALRRYGVSVNQIAAALHSGRAVPAWLEQAVAGADRAAARVDAVGHVLARRLA